MERRASLERFPARERVAGEYLERELTWLATEDRGRRLRVGRQTFHRLLSKLLPHMKHPWVNGERVSAARRLAVTLRFLCTCCTLEEMRNDTHIAMESLITIIEETCECIVGSLEDYVKCPQTEEEWVEGSAAFESATGFPLCLGGACARHIELRKSSKADVEYMNNEHRRPSVLLTAVVDANYEFIAVETCPGGKVSEENTLNTILEPKLESSKLLRSRNFGQLPYVFVGEECFNLQQNFMVPYTSASHLKNAQNVAFNQKMVKANQIAAKTLAIMVWRFGVLQTPVNFEQGKRVQTIVKACCYLHNFFKRECAYYMDNNMEAVIGADLAPTVWGPNTIVEPCIYDYDGIPKHVRDSFSRYFYRLTRKQRKTRSSE